MKNRIMLVLIILFFPGAVPSAMSFKEARAEVRTAQDSSWRHTGETRYRGKSKGPYFAMFIPRSIGVEEMTLYGYMLELSDEQIIFAEDQYEKYLVEEDALRTTLLPSLWDLSATLANGSHYRYAANGDELIRKFRNSRQGVLAHLKKHDDAFFNTLQTILDNTQLLLLERSRHQRERNRGRQSARYPIPGSDVDLSQILLELLWQEGISPPQEEDALSVFMVMYEESATALFRDYSHQEQRASFEAGLNDYELTQEKMNSDLDKSDEVRIARSHKHLQKLRSIKHRPVSLALDIVALHKKYADLFASDLVEPIRSYFIRQVRHTTCKAIYDDPFELSGLLDDISMIDTLMMTKHQRDALTITRESYLANRNKIEGAMIEKFVAYKVRRMETNSRGHDTVRALVDRIGVLDQQRLNNARTTLQQIRELLTAEQQRALSGALKAAEEQMKRPIVPFDKRVYL